MPIVPQNVDIFHITREISLLDVIRRFAPGLALRKQGREYVGLCPFHQERTPSFSVSPEKQLFFCFGCGAGGDAVKFVSLLLQLSPLEAAKAIAREFGLAVDEPLSWETRRKLAEARRRAELERAIAERLEVEINRAHQAVCLLLRTVTATIARALSRRDAETVKGLADLIRLLPRLEWTADSLYSPDAEDRLAALEEVLKWVS